MPIIQAASGYDAVAHLIQVDPTVHGYPAPVGASAYSFDTNAFYVKIGGGNTDWEMVSTGEDSLPTAWGSGYEDVEAALVGGEIGAFGSLKSRTREVVVEAKTPTIDLMTAPQVADFDFPLVDGSGGVRLYITTTRLVVVTKTGDAGTGLGYQFEQNGALAGQAVAAMSLAAFNGTGLALPYNASAVSTSYKALDMTTNPFQAKINSAPLGGTISAATGFFIATGYYR